MYQICSKTIMDTSDPRIVFDLNGISDYYHNYTNSILPNWHTDENGYSELMSIANKIKKQVEDVPTETVEDVPTEAVE